MTTLEGKQAFSFQGPPKRTVIKILNEKTREIASDYLSFAKEFPLSVDDYIKIRRLAAEEVNKPSFFSGKYNVDRTEISEVKTPVPPPVTKPVEKPIERQREELPKAVNQTAEPHKTLAFKPKEKKSSMLDMMRSFD